MVTFVGHLVSAWGYGRIWASPWGKIYSVGGGVFRLDADSWTLIRDSPSVLRSMFGVESQSVFVVGDFGNLLHFNGADWYQFPQFIRTDLVLFDVWTDGTEVFVVGTEADGTKTYILHGK
jgi:hypothetical protein